MSTPSTRRPRPEAKVISPPEYRPDLEAYGLKLTESGQIVPEIECPDPDPATAWKNGQVVDVRLWEGQFDRAGRLVASRITERLTPSQVDARYTKLRETTKLSESDWFSTGGYGSYGTPESPLTSNYVPLIPGPWSRQQYWADYWASSAKCYEAWNHSGIARRAVKAMVNFPLARGVQWRIDDQAAQDAWEEFWSVNKMDHRIRTIAQDLSIFGEQFLRFFPVKRGDKGWLLIRQLDPATIYEVVTDQEDLETVFFYHQQFQTRMELYSPPAGNRAPEGPTKSGVTRYIIRQIDAGEIDHYRINVVSGEARGRSDLFCVLADLKRLRDLLTAKVIQADIATRIMGVLKAKGTGADVNRTLNQIFPGGQAPAPGSFVGINDQVELDALDLSSSREVREDFTYQELIDSIVAGVGVSRADLGLSPAQSSGTTQSTALTQETSGGKAKEERQLLLKGMLDDMFNRVMDAAGIPDGDRRNHEFILPELAKEDRSAKLEDLEMAEANGWISKQTAATTAAGELGFTQYDFDEEMELIAAEFADADETDGHTETGADRPAQGGKIRRPVIRATSRQAAKLDPTRAQDTDDEPPGVLVGGPGGATAQNEQVPGNVPATQKTAGGLPAGKAPGTQRNRESTVDLDQGAHIRRTPDDPVFVKHVDEFTALTQKNLEGFLRDLESVG